MQGAQARDWYFLSEVPLSPNLPCNWTVVHHTSMNDFVSIIWS